MLTVMIIFYVFDFIDEKIGTYINQLIYWILARPQWGYHTSIRLQETWRVYFAWWFPFVIAVVGVYLFGRFIASWIGRVLWRFIESLLTRTPLVNQVYPSVKQVTDFVLAEKSIDFSRVVAVEYPRKGIWSLGMVTGPGLRTISETVKEDRVTVFIPTSPTPVTGYTINVRRDDIIDLPITIDEAFKFTLSAGVVTPLGELPAGDPLLKAARGDLPSLKEPSEDADTPEVRKESTE